MDHPNSFLVHQCLQAVSSSDAETLRALWADDIVWDVRGPVPWQGQIRGPDAIFDFLSELGELDTDGFIADVEDVMIGDERAAVVFKIKVASRGLTIETGVVLLARIAGRRIHEILSVPVDAGQVADFVEKLQRIGPSD